VRLLASRTFLGEVSVQTGVKGEPEVLKNAHQPLVTEREWEAAQRPKQHAYICDGSLASQTRLAGLVYCATCGQRLKTGGAGRPGKRVAQYICTGGECPRRVSIASPALDRFVADLLSASFLNRDPHVAAIMEGDTRYQDALEAVEVAKAEVDAYLEAVSVADVGRDSFKRGLDSRKAKLAEVRRVLAETPPRKRSKPDRQRKAGPPVTLEEAEPGLMREHNARFIAKVVVKPGVRGRRSNPAERAEVYLVGSDTPVDPAEVLPAGDAEVLAGLAAAAAHPEEPHPRAARAARLARGRPARRPGPGAAQPMPPEPEAPAPQPLRSGSESIHFPSTISTQSPYGPV
jgi:Recombinase zinc beta ribbon domain